MSAAWERRATPVAGSTMSGAELPEITTGASSGTVRSNWGSRARNVNFPGMPARCRSMTARGKRTFSPPASTRQP